MNARPTFRAGERVSDRTDADVLLVVIDPDRGRAAEVDVPARDATVAELNPSFSSTDRVVSCVHVDWLQRNVGDRWEAWPRAEFVDRLASFTAEWRLQIRSYDYPERRLQRLAPEESGQSTIDDW